MKVLLWKELRQLAPWGALMLAAMSAVTLGSLYPEWYRYDLTHVWSQVWIMIVCGGSGAAFAMGVLQTVLEVRRDQWAFLNHRGLSPTQIFLAKAGAGLSVYSVISVAPVIIGVGWCLWNGVDLSRLTWYHALPLLASFLASAAFYFSAMLAIVWKGPWYFSRLLPLVAPALMLFIVVGYTSEVTEYVPFWMFLAIAIAVGIHAVAAWGVFVKSGEATGRSRTANTCLAVPVFVALFAGCLCVSALAISAYILVCQHYEIDTAWLNRPATHFTVNRDGHVLQVVSRRVNDRRGSVQEYVSITDTDDPQSNKYAALVGQSPQEANELAGWDLLPLATVRDGGYSPLFGRLKSQVTPRHIIEDIGTTIPSDWIHWTYSTPDGLVFADRENRSLRNGRTLLQLPTRESVVGPDGFSDGTERPRRRFGNLLVSSGNPWRTNSQYAWQDLFKVSGNASRFCLLFDDGLYLVDPLERVVKPLLVPAGAQKIRCLTRLGDEVAVVYDDSISVHAALPVVIGTRKDPSGTKNVDESVDVPGEFQYSFPIHKEVARFQELFWFGRLSDRNAVVFDLIPGVSAFDSTRVIEMRMDGTIVRNRDFLSRDLEAELLVPSLGAVAALAPPGPVAAAIVVNEIEQLIAGEAPGTFFRLFRALPRGMLVPAAVLLCSSLFCFWSAGRTARRYGFDCRTRQVWQWTATLLGPAALLTLWFLRDWPAFEKCIACSSRRAVDRDVCPRCGGRAPHPPADGTEIILSEPALA